MPSAEDSARILVTRSQPGAAAQADALARAGFAVVQCPVLVIRPLDAAASRRVIAQLDRFDVAIFVSGHAVEYGMKLIDERWAERPSALTWIAVGAATAAALARHGIAAVVPAEESSEGILALPETSSGAARHVLIVGGRGGRSELATVLTQRGAHVERLDLYAREPIAAADGAALVGKAGAIAAVVISSADGGRAFAAVWRAAGGDSDVPTIAPSARVAGVLRKLGFANVVEAAGAGAAAVVDAVKAALGNSDE